MKLQVNNFRGKLLTGEKYMFKVKTSFSESLKQYMLDLQLHTECPLVNYSYELSFTEWYREGDYLKALKKALVKAENKLKIQLIKPENKAA